MFNFRLKAPAIPFNELPPNTNRNKLINFRQHFYNGKFSVFLALSFLEIHFLFNREAVTKKSALHFHFLFFTSSCIK